MYAGCCGDRRAQSVGRGDDGRCSQAADGLGRGHRGNTCAGERGSGSGGEPRAGDDARPGVGGPRGSPAGAPALTCQHTGGADRRVTGRESSRGADPGWVFRYGICGAEGKATGVSEGSPRAQGERWCLAARPPTPTMGQQPRRGIEELEGRGEPSGWQRAPAAARRRRVLGRGEGTAGSPEEPGQAATPADVQKYGCSMASRAVSRVWWS